MAVEKQLRWEGGNGILHDEHADMACVKVDVPVVVKGTCEGSHGKTGAQGKEVLIWVLIQGIGIGKQEVPGMDILLPGFKRHGSLIVSDVVVVVVVI